MTPYSDHLYQVRSLASRSSVIATDILSSPSATPSEKTVFQNDMCSNLVRSSTEMVGACRPRPYGIWRTREIHDPSARSCGISNG